MKQQGNILFCGVGGQGILLASEITAFVLIASGFDVKKSEVHGMAQRGGSVVAHLRYGEKVFSPLIDIASADIEVAFELLESVRYLPYLNTKSKVIVNTQKILPPSVSTGVEQYPDNLLDILKEKDLSVFPINAFDMAKEAGDMRAVNMVLVGALSKFIPVNEDVFFNIIEEKIPKKILEINRKAFIFGQKAVLT
ncbi:MAG: indolepyruvate oxidoreductase subunit beta [Desulfobacterales bacterium]|nr:indolepyruvate oxidoreductase subunit beta [Desulfobacterales bacterium]MBF0396880.1 indolepyruvate oxidoreductase subunit beta [Desulfobacterales bacterium]